MNQLESSLENRLRAHVRALGGRYIKLAPVGRVGLPDRLVLLPGARVGFLELKRFGKRPTGPQKRWLRALRQLGFVASWADRWELVETFLEEMGE